MTSSDDTGTTEGRRTRSLWPLFALLLVFVLPWVGAYLWRPTGYVNHGQLVEPARPVADIRLTGLDGEPVPFSTLRHKWVLLYVGGDQCDEPCIRSLYNIHQVRLAQSKNAHRVQNVYVVPASAPGGALEQTLARYPGTIGLRAPDGALEQIDAALEVDGRGPVHGPRRIYLVDPLGNFMMSYPPGADPSGIRKDLVRLLKVSQIG